MNGVIVQIRLYICNLLINCPPRTRLQVLQDMQAELNEMVAKAKEDLFAE